MRARTRRFPSERHKGAGNFTRPRVYPELNSEDVDPFLVWLLARLGLDPQVYRPKALQRRLPACLRALRAGSADSAKQLLEHSPDLLPTAADALLIGVTQFFRDPAVFAELETVIIPDLLTTRMGLRVCSAGCSEGHELCSVAMVLNELGRLQDSTLLGLDCRSKAIAQAGAGRFSMEDVNDLRPELKEKYFRIEGSRASLIPMLAERMEWRLMDLFSWRENSSWDLILFRNVAIYLEMERTGELWQRLLRRLAPGGVLVTGKAERPPPDSSLRRESHCIYRKME